MESEGKKNIETSFLIVELPDKEEFEIIDKAYIAALIEDHLIDLSRIPF